MGWPDEFKLRFHLGKLLCLMLAKWQYIQSGRQPPRFPGSALLFDFSAPPSAPQSYRRDTHLAIMGIEKPPGLGSFRLMMYRQISVSSMYLSISTSLMLMFRLIPIQTGVPALREATRTSHPTSPQLA